MANSRAFSVKEKSKVGDLCDIYKNKLDRFQEKYHALLSVVEKMGHLEKENSLMHSNLAAVTEELCKTQKAISDMKVYLFREREENLRLSAENDNLKVLNFEANYQLDGLLQAKRTPRTGTGRNSGSACRNSTSNGTLELEIQSLRTQLDNLQTFRQSEVDVLLRDREIVAEETSAELARLNKHISHLTTSLCQVRSNLQDAVKGFIFEHEKHEKDLESWREERNRMEKQIFLIECDQSANLNSSSLHLRSTKIMQDRLESQEALTNTYRKQCKQLRIELNKWRNQAESTQTNYKEKMAQLTSELTMMKGRYEVLDRRRLSEAEGFRSDIKFMRERIEVISNDIRKLKADEAAINVTNFKRGVQESEDVEISSENALFRAIMFEKEVKALKKKLCDTLVTSALGMDDEEYEELDDVPYADGTLGAVMAEGHEIETEETHIPYKSIFESAVPFKSLSRKVFIPNVPVSVRISKYERNVTKHLLNPYLYAIELEHGPFTWTIHKRYKHFLYLHQQLKLFLTGLMIPFPTDAHRRNRKSFRIGPDKADGPNDELPRLPLKPEMLIGFDEVERRSQDLEKYLQNLVNIPSYLSHPETVQFLLASHLSFVSGLGTKSVEGWVKKQTGSTHKGCCCGLLECSGCLRLGHLISDTCGCWRERWLVVKDTWLGYVRARDSTIRGVILFDHGFEVSASLYSSAIQVYNLQRRVVFKCRGRRKRTDWCQAIKNIAARQGFGFTQPNPYSSFAPTRSDTGACWFVDGGPYMEAVADAIAHAKEEIFIADWWLSPEIYLKRPSLQGHQWRLDSLLKEKADEGVQIFVLLYKEVEMALGINSYYSKSRLSQLHHQNIRVLRHPDHAHSGVFLWAHHEKIVCVDQTYAFLGGIDLCYGRWDSAEHRLVDFGSSGPIKGTSGDGSCMRKITSSRPLGSQPRSIATLMQNSKKIGRHVVAFNGSVESESVVQNGGVEDQEQNEPPVEAEVQPSPENVKGGSPELLRRSVLDKLQRSSKVLLSHLTGDFVREAAQPEGGKIENPKEVSEKPLEEKIAYENLNVASDVTDGLVGSCKYWLGKDYCNFIVKDFSNLDSPYQDIVDRNTTPRMPWHDVGVMVHGAAARDVARHFIHRWNCTKLEKAKNFPKYPYLIPKAYDRFDDPRPFSDATMFRVNCQVLRSVSSWSAGFQDSEVWEESIHEAYITCISKSKHYIYIENQFFISLARQNADVKNQVAEALYKRIVRAHKDQTVFRVFVVLPLLPGFEGEVGGPSGTALHAITHWNYASICRGSNSLIGRLVEYGIERPQDYVTFHGLRAHSEMNGDYVTELIYVHSKLMIVDDEIVICGSANINDRSLIGRRDSEIAVIIKDEEFTEATMNGQPTLVGIYASTLRKQLFSEHLGDPTLDLSDPIVDSFYQDIWRVISQTNTDTYEKVFQCLPSNVVTSFKKLQQYRNEVPMVVSDPCDVAAALEGIKGHLVNLPLAFLEEETLTPNPKSVEGLMPTALWT